MERTDQPNPQPSPARTLRDVAVIGTDRPGTEPMTPEEHRQWAALDQSFLATLRNTRINAAAHCSCCTRPAVTA